MKVKKYKHAGLVVQKENAALVIDPGEFCDGIEHASNVEALVITHIHSDHFDTKKVTTILNQNPDCQVYTIKEVAALLESCDRVIVVSAGDTASTKHFSMEFYGGTHAVIHEQAPRFGNVGVYIEGFYYPGDSFVLPNKSVKLLATPISGPWLKVSEAIDFMLAVAPQKAFGTHDALLSNIGLEFTHSWLLRFASQNNIHYTVLNTGDTIEI